MQSVEQYWCEEENRTWVFGCLPPASCGAEPCSCPSCTWYAVSTSVNHHSLHERAHSVCVHFSVYVFALISARKALYPSFLCSATCFSSLPTLCTQVNTSLCNIHRSPPPRERTPNSHLYSAWSAGHFLINSVPTSGSVWSEQKIRVSSKPVRKDLFTDLSRL